MSNSDHYAGAALRQALKDRRPVRAPAHNSSQDRVHALQHS